MSRSMPRACLALFAAMLATGCATTPPGTGVFLLLDTSGTYREELQKAEQIIRYTLSRLDASDTFAVARIDTGSFSENLSVSSATYQVCNAGTSSCSASRSRRPNSSSTLVSPTVARSGVKRPALAAK